MLKCLVCENSSPSRETILILMSQQVPGRQKPIYASSPVQEAVKVKEGISGPSAQGNAYFCLNGDAHIKIFIISGRYPSLPQACDKQPSSSLGEPPSNTQDRCFQFIQWNLNHVQSGTHLWYIRTRLCDLFQFRMCVHRLLLVI